MSTTATASHHEIDRLVTLTELARRLEVSERTLHRWHSLRTGPPRTRLGRAIYFRQTDLDAWIKAQNRDQT